MLSEAVTWLAAQRPGSERLKQLVESVEHLKSLGHTEERTAWLAGLGVGQQQVVDRWRHVTGKVEAFADNDAFDSAFVGTSVSPLVLTGSCDAALLFGSAAPTIDDDDALALARLLLDRFDPEAIDGLSDLVADEPMEPGVPAWEHGYELAEAVLDEVAKDLLFDIVEIERFLLGRGVELVDVSLSDRRLKAVAFAGPSHGPWAPLALEQQANAFAAMLLMPVDLVTQTVKNMGARLASPDEAREIAEALGVSATALTQHAGNVGLIDEQDRTDLLEELSPNV